MNRILEPSAPPLPAPGNADGPNLRFRDEALYPIAEKLAAGRRLSREDGLTLFASPDLHGVGALAHARRRQRHGDHAFYVYNQHVNYTNVCRNRCQFCAFARDRAEEGAYTYTLDDVRQRLLDRRDEPIREIHMVGGLNPALPFSHYLDLLAVIREIRPQATIKAFTAVEIDHLATISGMSLTDTLAALRDAGLGMIPGGGAEILSPRVHAALFPKKIDGRRWLEVTEATHRAGLVGNATMLYGHIETVEERVDHLLQLRDLQDRTGGFSAFIPLAFHPENTRLSHLKGPTAALDLKVVAVSRLLLDNIEHVKAYWVMLGEKLAQVALYFGADDLDGTIVEEKITHMAGATSPKGLAREEMERFILAAGFTAVERDSFYAPVRVRKPESGTVTVASPVEAGPRAFQGQPWAAPTRRLSPEEALDLLLHAPLPELGRAADETRWRRHPEPVVTFVVDRNINYTNVCVSGCRFCAFYKTPGQAGGYVITEEELERKVRETRELGGTQILLQGGMNPDLGIGYYEDLLRFLHGRLGMHVHGFSPPEIAFLSQRENLPVVTVIERLMAAGLGSIPGGGAEILADEVRSKVSPNKCPVREWLGVMRAAHGLGLRSTATMMFGHLEEPRHIVEHLTRIRDLQDETGGFTAFIPWTFQPAHTAIDVPPKTAAEYLRVLALSRLFLDNVPNIQASWVTQGGKIGQLALRFGANDLGSTMIEENVVAAAGVHFRLPMDEMIRLIREAGFTPVQRDCFYLRLKTFEAPAEPADAPGEAA